MTLSVALRGRIVLCLPLLMLGSAVMIQTLAQAPLASGYDRDRGRNILIDSRSASAAEILARVVQIEKRGVVLGDKSIGAVMESLQFTHTTGVDTVTFFGASVTEADPFTGPTIGRTCQ